jgi:hypothetical protein
MTKGHKTMANIFCTSQQMIGWKITSQKKVLLLFRRLQKRQALSTNLSKKEQGFIPLEQSLKYGTGTDESQISKMRYLPGKDVCNTMGEMVWRCESWHGLIVSRNTELLEQVVFERDWVNHNIKKIHAHLPQRGERKRRSHWFCVDSQRGQQTSCTRNSIISW